MRDPAYVALTLAFFAMMIAYLRGCEPRGLPAVPDRQAFGRAASFTTNTNCQSFGGETTMSYLSQMTQLAFIQCGKPAGGPGTAQVFLGELEEHLTPTEYKLLAVRVRHAGMVLTHRQLLKEVWGPNAVEQSHYLRVYMAELRHKLEQEPARPRYLVTESGVGYRLRTE
jgi:DNA-binding response OmpR family regulator